MNRKFNPIEGRVLQALAGRETPLAVEELARLLGLDQAPVSGAATLLDQAGLVALTEEPEIEFRLGQRGQAFAAAGFPERRVARALKSAGGRSTLHELPAACGLEAREVGEALRWLAQKKWAAKEGTLLIAGSAWEGPAEPAPQPDERLVEALAGGPRAAEDLDPALVEAGLKSLTGRSGVVERRERRRRLVRLTPSGAGLVASGLEVHEEVSELTTDLLVSGRWREVTFRPYDVSLPGPRLTQGKEHPFRRILQATRRVFLEMGFEETASPWVESAFWDFDALFQPQDHPARDMQDTFYLAAPYACELPDPALVERIRRTHQDGGDTGSVGWRTPWEEQLARRCVLRTHTTAATVLALSRDPRPPRKVFCVGPVFRRETIDYKHLPVFHQVDGIVIDQLASFAELLTLLSTFYRKMGFERIQFRPAFFPYTEPSVEVFVWMESRQDWFEMGGAGVFRPEVTIPQGCPHPVLAWGLGLERLAMFRFDLQDIRELYLAHLDWLKETPLCRF